MTIFTNDGHLRDLIIFLLEDGEKVDKFALEHITAIDDDGHTLTVYSNERSRAEVFDLRMVDYMLMAR